VTSKQTSKKSKYSISNFLSFIISREWLLAIIVTITLVLAGCLISIANNRYAGHNSSPVSRYVAEPGNKISYLANWDGVNYLTVAKSGYTTSRLTNFFPLYPLIIRVVNKVVSSPLVSGLIVSWAFMMGAIFYYLKVIKLLFKVDDNLEALRACLIFLLFPAAIYLMAVYTESLFAFLSLGAIYYALKKRYILAGLLTTLATLTHINGGFLVVLIALILLEEKERLRNVAISFVIGCLGLIGYMVFLWNKYGNPLEFIAAQHDHGWLRHSALGNLDKFSAVDYILAIAIIISIIYWWKRRKSFAIYSLFYLLIPIIGGQFGGYPRYTLMAFPLQFMLYDYLKDKQFIYQLMLILFSVGWTYFMLEFAAGYIVG
jgi:hypothetical protein